jgi:hypothetical protein
VDTSRRSLRSRVGSIEPESTRKALTKSLVMKTYIMKATRRIFRRGNRNPLPKLLLKPVL